MSSTIHYRFRSQNKPLKISFDGTGLTVFDLKKEIITANKMGPTTDFDIGLYNPETNEEYADDYTVIPRSSSVIARRFPSVRGTKANASRYVGGKPRISKTGKANLGFDQPVVPVTQNTTNTTNAPAAMIAPDKSASEQDKIKAMFQNQDMAWQEAQEMMENATPVYAPRGGAPLKTEAPPPGYICYKCGSKDHFIKDCPTTNDLNFAGRIIKRTAGIPKSLLRVVEKPTEEDADNYLLNDEGQYVIAIADSQAWDAYQKKQNMYRKLDTEEVKDKTLLDPISGKLFVRPVKTPCCGKTYSMESIENALIERDFVCPSCGQEDVLLDQLVEDKEMAERVRAYVEGESNEGDSTEGDSKRAAEEQEGGDQKRKKTE